LKINLQAKVQHVLERVVEWKEIHDEMIEDFNKLELSFLKEHQTNRVYIS